MIEPSVFQYAPDTKTLKLQKLSASDEEIKNALAIVPKEIIESIHEIDLTDAFLMQKLPTELHQFNQVKILRVANCHALESLEGVQNLKLSQLFASHCKKIENIDPLKDREIEILDLSYNLGLEDLSALSSIAKTIQELNLEGMPHIQTTRRLIGLHNLKVLNIKDTSITDTMSISFIPKIIV